MHHFTEKKDDIQQGEKNKKSRRCAALRRRAIRFKSSLRSGLSASIANALWYKTFSLYIIDA
jgi:hypothetical protein